MMMMIIMKSVTFRLKRTHDVRRRIKNVFNLLVLVKFGGFYSRPKVLFTFGPKFPLTPGPKGSSDKFFFFAKRIKTTRDVRLLIKYIDVSIRV